MTIVPKKTIYGYEARLRELMENNEHPEKTEEIFTDLLELAYLLLCRKRFANNDEDRAEIATAIAEDMYLNIINKSYVFTSYMRFIQRVMGYYTSDHYKQRWGKEEAPLCIDAVEEYELDGRYRRTSDLFEISEFEVLDYFERIDGVINQVLKESCRYEKGTI